MFRILKGQKSFKKKKSDLPSVAFFWEQLTKALVTTAPVYWVGLTLLVAGFYQLVGLQLPYDV